MRQKAANFNDKNQSPTQKMPTAFFVSDLYRQQATGNRQQATGNRQQATGNRQQATGNRQQATGNRYYTHLLTSSVNNPIAYISSLFIIFFSFILLYSHYFGKTPGLCACADTGFFYINLNLRSFR
jgi:uncharacterized protein YjbJ (UPF0337 family)